MFISGRDRANTTPTAGNKPRVSIMFHPTIQVPDIEEAQAWFHHVFGVSSAWTWSGGGIYNTKFGCVTMIRDLHINPMCPERLLVGGKQLYPTAEKPHLWTTSWYVEDEKMGEIYREMHRLGFRTLDRFNQLSEGDTPPLSPGPALPGGTGGRPSFLAAAEDAGLQYYFVPITIGEDGFLYGHMDADYRTKPGWSLPSRDEADPLGIDWCSHHTIVTQRPERGVKFVTQVLGGEVIHQGRDELRGTTCTYVHLVDAILEFAVPDQGTSAWADWESDTSSKMCGHSITETLGGERTEPEDTYHAITWKVADLDRAQAHLEAKGVRIVHRSSGTIVTDPETGLGVPWGFTTRRIPGDPRYRPDNQAP